MNTDEAPSVFCVNFGLQRGLNFSVFGDGILVSLLNLLRLSLNLVS